MEASPWMLGIIAGWLGLIWWELVLLNIKAGRKSRD